MVSADGEKVNGRMELGAGQRLEFLNSVFGSLRAEYFRDEVYELFTHPTYFPQLLNRRPCILVGGRGTGKTTVLKSLSYEGQDRLNPKTSVSSWKFIGIYWRLDTSVVRAFEGSELDETRWSRLFIHYLNLTLVEQLLTFIEWIEQREGRQVEIAARDIHRVAASLGSLNTESIDELRDHLDTSLTELEAVVNDPGSRSIAQLSTLGRPVQHLLKAFEADPALRGKTYFFLLDEYENLTNYQQRVVNTLIKHSGDHAYTFKIGMKETGHRERATINPDEQLMDPADYASINIADRFDDKSFADFARRVCESRLARIKEHMPILDTVDELFPSLGEEAEAAKLGVAERNSATRDALVTHGADSDDLAYFDSLSPLEAYLVEYWAKSQGTFVLVELRDARANSSKWDTRLTNYQHALLYTVRQRKRGISKYYDGWATYSHLANGNIRYLLQLVYEALEAHLTTSGGLSTPLSPETQTHAAASVGGRIVEDLQGLGPRGGDITRLVLGLGRIFGVMAADPYGHTPEVSQFRIGGNPSREEEQLLRSAVMHLALRRFATDKMASASGQIKDYSYQLHPIFAPFFVFSYRSKRRMDLQPGDLLSLVQDPNRTIPKVLRRSSRSLGDELPPQLSLFRDFFNDAD